MDNKKLGIILIMIGILLAGTIYMVKAREDSIIRKIVQEQGSCFLEDGTCLHEDRSIIFYVIGWIFSGAIIALGLYLLFFEKSQKEIISTLENQKQIQNEDEKFEQFFELVHMMTIDDNMLDEELNLCKIFAKKFGYKNGQKLVNTIAQNIKNGLSWQESKTRVAMYQST